jgi:Subtilase family
MKRVLLALTIGLSLFSVPAHADQTPTIAIIDSGVNDSLFTNIVGEYCVVEFFSCPNGKSTMEGTGAANLPVSTNATLTHGTEMASIINKVNPATKILPIRIVGLTATNLPAIYTNQAVKLALDWLVANQSKYNVKVVSISQGRIFAGCAVPDGMSADIDALKAKGVTVVAATGNDANRTAMMSPACLPNVVSVGATDNADPGTTGKAWDPTAAPKIATYSNGNAQTTYYTNGRYYALEPNGTTKFTVGTSNACAAMAAWISNHPVITTTTASNQWLTGKYVFIN